MGTILLLVGLLIFIGVAIWWMAYRRNPSIILPEDPTVGIFSSKPSTPAIVRSKFFSDQLYVGKQVKLDPSLRVMLNNLLFLFPTDALIVDKFKYFDVEGNPFEEIDFQKIGTSGYRVLYDKFENTMYFLNHVMTTNIGDGEVPPMASQDVVTLTENDDTYEYTDMSGLLQVSLKQDGQYGKDRLIRVYEREITPDDNEYLICIMDKHNVVDYYVGFNISPLQLEDI